jgi:hypothetical protein
LASVQTSERVVLSSYESSHVRAGAAWLADHKNDFSRGFINSASSLYENVYDQNGHKVVDRRTLRNWDTNRALHLTITTRKYTVCVTAYDPHVVLLVFISARI